MKNLYFIFILFIISNHNANAQLLLKNLPQEKEVIITNNTLFLVGETLKYKLLVLNKENNSPLVINKMGYVYLVDFDKNVRVSQKLFLKKGSSNGDFLIASNLATGHYKLVFTTNQNLNSSLITSGVKDIYIINPYQKFPKEKEASNTTTITKEEKLSKHYIFNVFNKRQKVELSIDTLNLEDGNYTINVQKIDSLNIINENLNYSYKNPTTKFHIPEIRGELISGKLLDLKGKPLKNKGLSVSIINNPNLFKNVITDSLGNFYVSILNNYNKGNIIINTLDLNLINQCKIILNNKEVRFKDQFKFNNIKIDKNLFNWLQQKSTNVQIENAYFKYKKDSVFQIKKRLRFYGDYTKSYLLDDYTRFPTVKETFTEIIDLAYERKKHGKHHFYINFGDENFKKEHLKPLIVIDGVQIINHDILFNYNSNKIKQINILNKMYFSGPFSYNGIIEIETFDGNYTPNKNDVVLNKKFTSPLKKKKYFQPNYEVNSLKYKRIPDFRTALYWNPELETKTKKVSFYTSDITGLFKINIQGYSKKGKVVNKNYYFKVK